MTCLLNYAPDEQSELQWLAAEANLEHRQAQHFHDTVFSSTSGCLKAWRLADQLQDTLWALSMVYSRALTVQVSCMHEQCCACCAVLCSAVLCLFAESMLQHQAKPTSFYMQSHAHATFIVLLVPNVQRQKPCPSPASTSQHPPAT